MTGGPEDIDRVVEELDANGDLDEENVGDRLITMVEALRLCGADPEDPRSYRAMLAVAALLKDYHPLVWLDVMDEICRLCFRALRDLKKRGNG